MNISRLLHEFADACFAELECLERIRLGLKLFAPEIHASAREVYLAKGLLTLGVLGRIDHAQDLQIVHAILLLFVGSVGMMTELALVRIRLRSKFQP